MAFYCSHIGLDMVNADNELMIYGPVIMNAEVVLYQGNIGEMDSLGLPQNREYLKELAKEKFIEVEKIVEIGSRSLPYALENQQIDGAIMDITKASLLPQFEIAKLTKDDVVSYVLVVRKDIVNTKEFQLFLDAYNQEIEQLKDRETLAQVIGVKKEVLEEIGLQFLELQ